MSGGCYSILISLEIPPLPPASFRGASAKTSFLLVGTSKHLASTNPSAMISWQVLPRCFREQRFKSYVGSRGASARASASIMLPQNLPHASARTANHLERSQELFPYLSIGRQAQQKNVAHMSYGRNPCLPNGMGLRLWVFVVSPIVFSILAFFIGTTTGHHLSSTARCIVVMVAICLPYRFTGFSSVGH